MTIAPESTKKPVMDLVVPIHGQLAMNKIFFHCLARNTSHPFRLIVVDNNSQDASADFFESQNSEDIPVLVLRNSNNQCYPVSVNQGVRAGQAPVVGFLNNDILVGPGWDNLLLEGLLMEGYPLVSPAGLEHFPDRKYEEILFQRWRYINRRRWSHDPEKNILEKIHRMYEDFDRFAEKIQKRYRTVEYKGIMGHCHLMKRETFDRLGGLDPCIQAADWDLYLTLARKNREEGFEKNPMILGGYYVHHFIRLTDATTRRMPVVCTHEPHRTLEEKWERKDIQELWPFKDQVPGGKKGVFERIRKKYIRTKNMLYYWRVSLSRILPD